MRARKLFKEQKEPRTPDSFEMSTGYNVRYQEQLELIQEKIKRSEKEVKELQEIVEESGKMSNRAEAMFASLGKDLVGLEEEIEKIILGDGPRYHEEISESNIPDPTYVEDDLLLVEPNGGGRRRGRHSSRKRRRGKTKRSKCKSKRKR